tara:strand:+ start:3407 stop:3583 length:177 start_codon:yes stop_codon:yes gene_type:complete
MWLLRLVFSLSRTPDIIIIIIIIWEVFNFFSSERRKISGFCLYFVTFFLCVKEGRRCS